MSVSSEIRVQKKQTKNRMVGETFNPTGITSEQILDREQKFVVEMKDKNIVERLAYWKNVQEMLTVWMGSWPWEWCAFKRNFIRDNSVI